MIRTGAKIHFFSILQEKNVFFVLLEEGFVIFRLFFIPLYLVFVVFLSIKWKKAEGI